MIITGTVLLLKSQKSDGETDRYEVLLKKYGFVVQQAKTLVFVYKNLDLLKEKLEKSDDYCGILLSSPRCVHAIELAVNRGTILQNWKNKHNFVVGETTYNDALIKLTLDCKGKESGNAVNLSQVILKEKDLFNKPFLFPHGNLKTDTLNLELGKQNISIEGVLVYDTIANPHVEQELDEITNNFTKLPEIIVFFSPSGFRCCINLIRKVSSDLSSVKLIAIGPVTELAIQEEGLKVYAVAKKPTPEEVLASIIN